MPGLTNIAGLYNFRTPGSHTVASYGNNPSDVPKQRMLLRVDDEGPCPGAELHYATFNPIPGGAVLHTLVWDLATQLWRNLPIIDTAAPSPVGSVTVYPCSQTAAPACSFSAIAAHLSTGPVQFAAAPVFLRDVGCAGAVVGASGVTGHTGPTGHSGPKGYVRGHTGPRGATGIRGPTGPGGAPYPDGTTAGDPGPQGYTGPQGQVGAQPDPFDGTYGMTGPTGYTGWGGTKGEQGPGGPTGLPGIAGADGPDGYTGPSVPGPTGPRGYTGIPYTNVNPGGRGPDGGTGPDGVRGQDGVPGFTGYTGATGATGPSGAEGATGATGFSGTSSARGMRGLKGLTGPTGHIPDIWQDGPPPGWHWADVTVITATTPMTTRTIKAMIL